MTLLTTSYNRGTAAVSVEESMQSASRRREDDRRAARKSGREKEMKEASEKRQEGMNECNREESNTPMG